MMEVGLLEQEILLEKDGTEYDVVKQITRGHCTRILLEIIHCILILITIKVASPRFSISV
jgi:hypothetical protein